MTGEDPDPALVENDQGAVAVMLDLVNPAITGGRLRDEDRNFRLDEAKRGISGSM